MLVLPSDSITFGLRTFIFPSFISISSFSMLSEISLTISCILWSMKLLKDVRFESKASSQKDISE